MVTMMTVVMIRLVIMIMVVTMVTVVIMVLTMVRVLRMTIDNEARKVAVLTLEQHTQTCDDDHDYCGSHDEVFNNV